MDDWWVKIASVWTSFFAEDGKTAVIIWEYRRLIKNMNTFVELGCKFKGSSKWL